MFRKDALRGLPRSPLVRPRPIPFAAEQDLRRRARERLFEALQAVHLRGETHITVRELRAALVYILFGIHFCDDYHASAEQGIAALLGPRLRSHLRRQGKARSCESSPGSTRPGTPTPRSTGTWPAVRPTTARERPLATPISRSNRPVGGPSSSGPASTSPRSRATRSRYGLARGRHLWISVAYR